MSEAKFTKGVWKIFDERVGIVDDSDTQSYGIMLEVAFVDMYNFSPEECKANAHLIAAAAAMYHLLDEMASHDECQMFKGQINKLLAKARGEKNA